MSNRYLTEQEVAQRSENMSSTFDAPFFETRNNTIEDDWDGDLLLENTAHNQDKGTFLSSLLLGKAFALSLAFCESLLDCKISIHLNHKE